MTTTNIKALSKKIKGKANTNLTHPQQAAAIAQLSKEDRKKYTKTNTNWFAFKELTELTPEDQEVLKNIIFEIMARGIDMSDNDPHFEIAAKANLLEYKGTVTSMQPKEILN